MHTYKLVSITLGHNSEPAKVVLEEPVKVHHCFVHSLVTLAHNITYMNIFIIYTSPKLCRALNSSCKGWTGVEVLECSFVGVIPLLLGCESCLS